jgi:hypothetical protein
MWVRGQEVKHLTEQLKKAEIKQVSAIADTVRGSGHGESRETSDYVLSLTSTRNVHRSPLYRRLS